MSVYYDASTVLAAASRSGSLKSSIYDNKLGLRSKPAHLYALISETAKYDSFLTEVIDKADFLAQEPKVGLDFTSVVSPLTDASLGGLLL